jgi:hypothetical protein
VPVSAGLYYSPRYAVRFRGWFVNGEMLIENWAAEPENAKHWRKEPALACRGRELSRSDTKSLRLNGSTVMNLKD